MLCVVLLLSIAVFLVLHLWSSLFRSRGQHAGLAYMTRETSKAHADEAGGLSLRMHLMLALLGLANGICEECVSRGFWYVELQRGGLGARGADFVQCAAFGIAHLQGTPGGVSGVLLTFVYGILMSVLREGGSGMLLPFLAHGLADYYIFAFISRRMFADARDKDS
jgi:membrane protease YdiL (CAAX protease family)